MSITVVQLVIDEGLVGASKALAGMETDGEEGTEIFI